MYRRATQKQVEAAADLLWRIAEKHGLSDLHLGPEPGEVVAAIDDGRTYFDVVAFADEIEGMLGWWPDVTLAGAPGAKPGPKLTRSDEAA
jgi:hypothetical protein